MRHSRVSPAPPPGYESIWVVPCLRDPPTIQYTNSVYNSRFMCYPSYQVISGFWRLIGRAVLLPLHYFPIIVEKRSCRQRGQLQGFISVFDSIFDTLRHSSQRTFGQFGINSMIGLFFLAMRYNCSSSLFRLYDHHRSLFDEIVLNSIQDLSYILCRLVILL